MSVLNFPCTHSGGVLRRFISAMALASLLITFKTAGQQQPRTFVSVAPAELSSSFVRCIYKDSKGFVWFGTGTGLIRYDGTKVYRHDHVRGNGNAITDNRINAIIEDKNSNLWIGTAQGLVIYNREKDTFTDVDSLAGIKNHLNNRYITALCMDREDRVWIGTHGQGINIFDPRTLTFTHLTESTVQNRAQPSNYILAFMLLDDMVWTGTKGGLQIFSTRDLRTTSLPVSDGSVASKEITQVSRDLTGNIWLTTMDREIIRLSPAGEHYQVQKRVISSQMLREAEGNLLTLSVDAENNVWTAGENTGLNMLDSKTGEITRHSAHEDDNRKLPTNSIRSVYTDNTGIIWIGTYNRGAYMIDNKAKKFTSFHRSEFLKAGMEGHSVRSLVEDQEGNIWIAGDGGGLARLDRGRHELIYAPDLNNKIGTRYLSALLIDDEENLWIGTWGRGVFKLDPKTGQVKSYKIESGGFGDNKVFCLYQDSRKKIWVGSVGSGLFYFDSALGEFVGLNEEKKADYISKSAYVSYILEDADSALWVATLFGLYRLESNADLTYKVTRYEKSDVPGGIGSFDIQTIYRDGKDNLWFGTGDYGLAMLPRASSSFKQIRRQDGLVSNSIRGVQVDAKEKIWISTNMGLSKYDPVENTFRHFSQEDGLPSNEFNANACLTASDGKLYFGSDRGLVAFHPDSIRDNPTRPVVYFTDLKLNNQSAQIDAEGSPLTKHISLTSDIHLQYNQRSFSIDFVAVNYGQSSRNQYCYKLEGFDEDWNCVGSNNRATYTNIDPGNYTFLVKASNSDGIASEVPARLAISIQQTPWKAWWAVMSYLLIICGAVYIIFRIRIERIKMTNQLELERVAREKEHALGESKTQFFTNISHEFRTPLSLITMPLESLTSMNDLPPNVRERLATMRTSAEKMTRLVNELMDFNKLESAKLKLHVRPGELVHFIQDVASVFHDVAAKRNIHFGVHAMVRSLEGWFDRDKLEKILVNVLSNAFKFTADNGQINVIINAKDQADDEFKTRRRILEVTIVDNGIGIPAEELPFIFDKFYQARSSEKISNPGTGIGLSLTKGLVELHHGTIYAESMPAAETRFLIQLPIDRQAYRDEELGEPSAFDLHATNGKTDAVSHPSGASTHEDPDKPHILVVEDNEELRKYIAMELRQQFFVLEAADGREGLQLAFEKTPDLIISDILMPFKTGIELCREIKSNLKTSHIPFILLTAKAMVEDQIEGISTGADVYITKPFSIRFLVTHVNQIIESRQKLYARFSQDVYLLPGKIATNEIDQAFLQKAIDFITENLQDPQLGVDSIADLFNLSRMQVYRKIKALSGKSVVEFIRMVRVKQALKLMEAHKFTLSEIAFQTGFNSSSYFTRVFKDEFGKTPSEYLEKS